MKMSLLQSCSILGNIIKLKVNQSPQPKNLNIDKNIINAFEQFLLNIYIKNTIITICGLICNQIYLLDEMNYRNILHQLSFYDSFVVQFFVNRDRLYKSGIFVK